MDMLKVSHIISTIAPIILTLSSVVAQQPTISQAVVSGIVLNATTGEPLAKVPIRLQRYPNDDAVYSKSNDQGRFEFSGLSAGRYRVEARLPGFLSEGETPNGYALPAPLDLATPTALRAPSQTRTLEPDGILRSEIRIQLTPQAVLTGRITDPDGLPQAETQVEVLTQLDAPPGVVTGAPIVNGRLLTNVCSTSTDDQGEYRAAPLPPGSYWVRVSMNGASRNLDPSFRTTFHPRAADLAAARAIQLSAGEEARADIQIIRHAGVRINGRLLMPSMPNPEPGTALHTNCILRSKRPGHAAQEFFYGRTQGDHYEASELLPGVYELTAVTYQVSAKSQFSQMPLFSASSTVEIGSSDVSGPDLELRSLPRLEATLRLAEGCPDSGAQLSLSGTQGMPSAIQVQPGQSRIGLPPLLPGFQRVQLAGPDGRDFFARSIRVQVGDLPVQDNGFETPTQDGTPIRIDVTCFNQRGVR